jgi:hypothetical protein
VWAGAACKTNRGKLQRKTLARSGRQGAAEPKSTNGCSDTVRKSGKEGRVDAKVIKVAVGSVEPVKRAWRRRNR